MTRRELITSAGVALAPGEPRWNAEWDRTVLESAVRRQEASFDAGEQMLVAQLGPEYRYHTALGNQRVHPTRDSLDFALLLLELGEQERLGRARAIVDRVISLQNTGADSRWYGIWGWYMEEPPEKMAPADWNWADFLGSLLLLIENRHGERLGEPLRARVREAIRHAAYSVKRRNVAMSYTNIAVKGTFVAKAASELLEDEVLAGYAGDRIGRLETEIARTGSFAEYNSPTYALVSIVNFTRFRMLVRDRDARRRMDALHDRMWLHFARRWHPPTRQFAGPMSRCYETELRHPIWLQKALGGELEFASMEEIRQQRVPAAGEIAYLDLSCPEPARRLFTGFREPVQYREVFISAAKGRPVQGTTYLDRRYCLGTANRSEFWVQRRPLLAYWGDATRPVRYLQLRVIKDDYDFSSAAFYSVQNGRSVLGCISFFSPGGDRHPSLEPIQNGEFLARRLAVQFLFQGLRRKADWSPRAPAIGDPVEILADGMRFRVQPLAAAFGERRPSIRITESDSACALEILLFSEDSPANIRWADIGRAFCLFGLEVSASGRPVPARLQVDQNLVRATWPSPDGVLELAAGIGIRPKPELDAQFEEMLDRMPVPVIRLN
ncbi:MAG: hypothetical protein HY235_03595 [Acidobacteria bacterium]|nr:hypothetical protein [Acidobacteriota bacterium]